MFNRREKGIGWTKIKWKKEKLGMKVKYAVTPQSTMAPLSPFYIGKFFQIFLPQIFGSPPNSLTFSPIFPVPFGHWPPYRLFVSTPRNPRGGKLEEETTRAQGCAGLANWTALAQFSIADGGRELREMRRRMFGGIANCPTGASTMEWRKGEEGGTRQIYLLYLCAFQCSDLLGIERIYLKKGKLNRWNKIAKIIFWWGNIIQPFLKVN